MFSWLTPDDKDNKSGGAWATGKIADAILALGKEFGCHVLALSQLDLKEILKRPDKKPNKGDLRWSANWAQNADNILFIHRPILYESMMAPEPTASELPADHRQRVEAWRLKRERIANQAHLLVDKVRNGPAGYVIDLMFEGSTATFSQPPAYAARGHAMSNVVQLPYRWVSEPPAITASGARYGSPARAGSRARSAAIMERTDRGGKAPDREPDPADYSAAVLRSAS